MSLSEFLMSLAEGFRNPKREGRRPELLAAKCEVYAFIALSLEQLATTAKPK